jgi:hypothetical protein
VIADDTKLGYSDNYRAGWPEGFRRMGCDVQVVDIGFMRNYHRIGGRRAGPMSMRSVLSPKQCGREIAKREPDLVWFHHGRNGASPELLNAIRESGALTACYLCDEPYETGETAIYARHYDHAFTMDACTLEVHRRSRRERKNVWYLPPGTDTEFFRPGATFGERTIPALFLGNGKLTPREKYLRPVARLVKQAVINYFGTVGKGNKQKWIPLEQHPSLFGDTQIGLNIHRDPRISKECFDTRVRNRPKDMQHPAGLDLCQSPTGWGTGFWNDGDLPASHWSPRFMDMSACGCLVINDGARSEIEREFDFVPQADDPQHFVELVLHYIANPDKAEEIGRACAERISKRHDYRHRAAEVLIRLGLKDRIRDDLLSSLGAPREWLTPQELDVLSDKSPLGRTGRSDTWIPRYGSALTNQSSSRNATTLRDRDPGWWR